MPGTSTSRVASPIRQVAAAAYRVPTPARESDGTLDWDGTTAVVVHVDCGDVRGVGWTYADASCVDLARGVLADAVTGLDARRPVTCWHAMQRRVRNLGRPGLASCAMSAVDIAVWDAAAQLAGLPVSMLLGQVHDEVDVYGSGGFTSYDEDQLTEQLQRWVHRQRIARVKIKIGESWGARPGRDLERIAQARSVIGPDAELYVDANGAYSVGQAVRLGLRMAEHDVTWFEEPVSSDDLDGLHHVRAAVTPDVTAGEYGYDLPYFARMIGADAVDCMQVDVTRCGGYTEWLRVAAVAAAHNLDVSAHCAPNITVPVALATANLRHLEWFADHERLEPILFDGTVAPVDGRVGTRPDVTGHGLTLNQSRAAEYLLN
jgi:L-alanine-DL-glutamate epimerase-like enolase superfamily enzyme